MLFALVEHMSYMRCQRHEPQQVLGEEPFPRLRPALRKDAPGGRDFEHFVLDLGEIQNVERVGDRKDIVDLEPSSAAI